VALQTAEVATQIGLQIAIIIRQK